MQTALIEVYQCSPHNLPARFPKVAKATSIDELHAKGNHGKRVTQEKSEEFLDPAPIYTFTSRK